LITHIHIYHSINDITEFVCKESYCFRIFDSLNSYKKHLKNSHSNLQNQISNNSNLEIHQPDSSNLINVSIINTEEIPFSENIVLPSNFIDNLKEKLQLSALKLISKWYSNNSIPRNIVLTLLDDITNFNDYF